MGSKKTCNPEIREMVFEKFGGCCAYCGCYLGDKFHLDHFVPKRRCRRPEYRDYSKPVGDDSIENLMPSCASCNSCKSNLDLEEFRDRVEDRITRLRQSSGEYNIALRFGLIQENHPLEVIFHFEKFLKIDA